MSEHFIIAIDGPSGTGKSTTAKIVAKHLGITYLDTGAMYRAITFAALESNVAPTDNASLLNLLKNTEINFGKDNKMFINGICREKEIRGTKVSGMVSPYSANAVVRSALTQKQREIAGKQSCILDGRDIGTVVFPNAKYKFFLITDIKVRAKRRYEECIARGETVTLSEIETNLAKRDAIDSSRENAPLKKAADAIEIDTTHISIQQQVQKILDYVGVVA